ncbi:MAG: hypothetical protein HY253_11945 [Burkholderiales bacterium]|nr:hypothetical protein [Burkholderiales bacterium]
MYVPFHFSCVEPSWVMSMGFASAGRRPVATGYLVWQNQFLLPLPLQSFP